MATFVVVKAHHTHYNVHKTVSIPPDSFFATRTQLRNHQPGEEAFKRPGCFFCCSGNPAIGLTKLRFRRLNDEPPRRGKRPHGAQKSQVESEACLELLAQLLVECS